MPERQVYDRFKIVPPQAAPSLASELTTLLSISSEAFWRHDARSALALVRRGSFPQVPRIIWPSFVRAIVAAPFCAGMYTVPLTAIPYCPSTYLKPPLLAQFLPHSPTLCATFL